MGAVPDLVQFPVPSVGVSMLSTSEFWSLCGGNLHTRDSKDFPARSPVEIHFGLVIGSRTQFPVEFLRSVREFVDNGRALASRILSNACR